MRNFAIGLLAFVVALTASCGTGPGETEPSLPTVGDGGGVVEGPDGVSVGVPSGATGGDEVGIDLGETDDVPDGELDDGAIVSGGVYTLRASEGFDAGGEDPIVLSIPLPDGVATAQADAYQLGIRLPAGSLTNGAEAFWHVMPAERDPTTGALLLPLFGLPGEEMQVAVVQMPTGFAAPSASGRLEPNRVWASDVKVQLKNAPLFGDADAQEDVRATVRQMALDAISRYQELGFDAPVWQREFVAGGRFVLNVRHESEGICPQNVFGTYNNFAGIMYVCYFQDDVEQTRYTVNHEAFHAVQNAYLNFADSGAKTVEWFVESTATLAERSLVSGEAKRSPDTYPDPGTGLARSDGEYVNPYGHQDFWAYLLRSNGRSFDDLVDFMNESATITPADAGAVLASHGDYPRHSSFEDAYWSYAKNQAWEHRQSLGDGDEAPVATAEDGVIFDARPYCAPTDPDGPWPWPIEFHALDGTFGTSDEDAFALEMTPLHFVPLSLDVPDVAELSDLARLTVTATVDGKPIDEVDAAHVKYYLGDDCLGDTFETGTLDLRARTLLSSRLVILIANASLTQDREFTLEVAVSVPDAPDITGVWAGTYHSDAYSDIYGLLCAELEQTGEVLTGTLYQDGAERGAVEGTLTSDRLSLGVVGVDDIEFSGYLRSTGRYLAGRYTAPFDDEGTWAVVPTTASSCAALDQPEYTFQGAVGTYTRADRDDVGMALGTVWNFAPYRPLYTVEVGIEGPSGWNGDAPMRRTIKPSTGFGGSYWVWWRMPSTDPADGSYRLAPDVDAFVTTSSSTVAVDASRSLEPATDLEARMIGDEDSIDVAWEPVAGAEAYQVNLHVFENDVFLDRWHSSTTDTSYTYSWLPSSTADATYTYEVYIDAFSNAVSDYSMSGGQFDVSTSLTAPVLGAAPPASVQLAPSSAVGATGCPEADHRCSSGGEGVDTEGSREGSARR